jgi:hypothetical protein
MLNQYFNNFPGDQVTSEQLLIEDLLIESIKQYGMDVYYIPRESRDSIDRLFGEETLKKFRGAFSIEMYLESIMGMEGQQDIITKFGLELDDEIRLLVARRRFNQSIPRSLTKRPREGDLVYVPLVQNFFEIIFVEHENEQAMMYTLGKGRGGNVYVYALKLKQFVFSEEQFNTGVEELDDQMREEYKRTILTFSSGSGTFNRDEIVYQGSSYAQANSKAIAHSWDTSNSKLYVTQTVGAFTTTKGVVKGLTSGAQWTLSDAGDNMTPFNDVFEDIADNKRIEDEANQFINFSETNPFGEP